jgi:hypothetical protein
MNQKEKTLALGPYEKSQESHMMRQTTFHWIEIANTPVGANKVKSR